MYKKMVIAFGSGNIIVCPCATPRGSSRTGSFYSITPVYVGLNVFNKGYFSYAMLTAPAFVVFVFLRYPHRNRVYSSHRLAINMTTLKAGRMNHVVYVHGTATHPICQFLNGANTGGLESHLLSERGA